MPSEIPRRTVDVVRSSRCSHNQRILLAGSLHGGQYLNEFLRNCLPQCGEKVPGCEARLEGSAADFKRPKRRASATGAGAPAAEAAEERRGFVRSYTLAVGDRRIPVYFCSSGLSDARDKRAFLVAERVERDAGVLRDRYLGGVDPRDTNGGRIVGGVGRA